MKIAKSLGVRGLVTVLLVAALSLTFVDICTKTIDKSMDNKTVTSPRTPKFIAKELCKNNFRTPDPVDLLYET